MRHVRCFTHARVFAIAASVLATSCGSDSVQSAGDAALDAAVHDATAADSPTDDVAPTDGGTCAPSSVTTVPPYRPAVSNPSACSPSLVEEFYNDCLVPSSTQDTCAPFSGPNADAAHKTCESCLVRPATAAKQGPLVLHDGFISLNVAGCMELLDVAAGADCAKRYSDVEVCDDLACQSCPVYSEASFAEFESCTQAAETSVCSSYATAAKACTDAEEDGGPASQCFRGQTFHDSYVAIATVFCANNDGGG